MRTHHHASRYVRWFPVIAITKSRKRGRLKQHKLMISQPQGSEVRGRSPWVKIKAMSAQLHSLLEAQGGHLSSCLFPFLEAAPFLGMCLSSPIVKASNGQLSLSCPITLSLSLSPLFTYGDPRDYSGPPGSSRITSF